MKHYVIENPDNSFACQNCLFFVKKETSVFDDGPDGYEHERKLNCFYCEKKQHFLYLPQNEIKRNWIDMGVIQEVTPKECSDFVSRYDYPTDFPVDSKFKEKFEEIMKDLNIF
jgi:hypothetical protein